jgi:hypothetical protein
MRTAIVSRTAGEAGEAATQAERPTAPPATQRRANLQRGRPPRHAVHLTVDLWLRHARCGLPAQQPLRSLASVHVSGVQVIVRVQRGRRL